MEAAIIVTYRCQSRCRMCGIWKHPTRPEDEFSPSLLEKLPHLAFANITGGEPLLRDDLEDIVRILKTRARRIVVSTNGHFTDRVLALASRHRDIGFRISLEGLAEANDELRGVEGGFERSLRTVQGLKALDLKDVGFGITLSDRNAGDLLPLFELAASTNLEFATAAVHNSFYFHCEDNVIQDPERVARQFERLAGRLLRTRRPKNWFRAYFNMGLAEYVRGRPRPLPCRAGADIFFLDPAGRILPCNGMEERFWFDSLGSLHERPFNEIWQSDHARKVRGKVARCPKNCWMIGTASPAMKRSLGRVARWVLASKLRGRPRPLR